MPKVAPPMTRQAVLSHHMFLQDIYSFGLTNRSLGLARNFFDYIFKLKKEIGNFLNAKKSELELFQLAKIKVSSSFYKSAKIFL